MAASNKAQFLNDIHDLLKKQYPLEPRADRLSVLEAIVYGICHEGTTREQANQALSRFKDDFFDWNEVRVSSLTEIQGVLAGVPDPEGRAHRLRRFLRLLFETTYGFNLDAHCKKPQKEAVKVLHDLLMPTPPPEDAKKPVVEAYQEQVRQEAASTDYVLAIVTQQALGGHALPVDEPTRRALVRLGVVEPSAEPIAVRSTLERAVPKNRAGEFADLMEELAHDTCVAGPPDCPRCALLKLCPAGQQQGTSADKVAHPIPAAKASKAPRTKSSPTPPKVATKEPHVSKDKTPRPK